MIYALPGEPFEVVFSDAPTGLVGTLGVRVIDNATGATVIARTTAGITEPIAGTGLYIAHLTAPEEGGQYSIISDQGGALEPSKVAVEELVVSFVAGAGSPEEPEAPGPGIDFTNIIDNDFPVVDRLRVAPSVEEVALLERTRTVDQSGEEQGTFTTATRPTLAEVNKLIAQALELTLSDLPDYLPESIYPRIQQAVALRAAVLVEISFYREQYNQGSARAYDTMYDKLIASIELLGGSGAGRRVDSIMGRSTMAEFEPDLPIPPPRIIVKTPFPIDGNPDSEGQ
jgi:hypothetical protein